MKLLAGCLLAAAGLLAGCGPDASGPPAIALVKGPQFAAERFDCGRAHPAPPDPDIVPAEAVDRAAAGYEILLDAWGRSCRDRLRSVGAELKAAGQVTAAPLKLHGGH